ncbi:MAG: hypothetical protein J1F69_00290 [Clostridiales bacterium]|nr:hypothetical protein [Clostridiales bacterium]
MDKTATALIATEDNTAAIRALSNKLNTQAAFCSAAIDDLNSRLEKQISNTCISGKSVNGILSFGVMASDGNTCVVLSFDDSAMRTVKFGSTTFNAIHSPLIMVLPKGSGELTISAPLPAQALILGSPTSKL